MAAALGVVSGIVGLILLALPAIFGQYRKQQMDVLRQAADDLKKASEINRGLIESLERKLAEMEPRLVTLEEDNDQLRGLNQRLQIRCERLASLFDVACVMLRQAGLTPPAREDKERG